MNAFQIVDRLERCGITLQARDGKLRFFPPTQLTPDLLGQLKAHKAEILDLLRFQPVGSIDDCPRWDDLKPFPVYDAPLPGLHSPIVPREPLPPNTCDRCKGTEYRDTTIHDGQSLRRDCVRCGRFISFPRWYGKSANNFKPYRAGQSTCLICNYRI